MKYLITLLLTAIILISGCSEPSENPNLPAQNTKEALLQEEELPVKTYEKKYPPETQKEELPAETDEETPEVQEEAENEIDEDNPYRMRYFEHEHPLARIRLDPNKNYKDTITTSFSLNFFDDLDEESAYDTARILADKTIEFIYGLSYNYEETIKQIEPYFSDVHKAREYLDDTFLIFELDAFSALIMLDREYFGTWFFENRGFTVNMPPNGNLITVVAYVVSNGNDMKGEISVGFLKEEENQYKIFAVMI